MVKVSRLLRKKRLRRTSSSSFGILVPERLKRCGHGSSGQEDDELDHIQSLPFLCLLLCNFPMYSTNRHELDWLSGMTGSGGGVAVDALESADRFFLGRGREVLSYP